MSKKFGQGSLWRKWDLHIHTPKTKLNDNYKTTDGSDVLEHFCDVIENSDVDVFGITDYFSADNYFKVRDKFFKKYPDSEKRFLLNIELHLNESVNRVNEEVNVHIIFNPIYNDKAEKFLSKLCVVKTGERETQITCADLKTKEDFESAAVTRDSIKNAFEDTFGKKAIRQNHFLIFTAANNDGIRPLRGKRRKETITDEIDKISDGFFGGNQNVNYFLKIDRLEDKNVLIGKKPVISGCDAHSFEQLAKNLGKRVVEQRDGKENIISDITWIKADPTFDGLKQILYEPEPGERVKIGPVEPDQKEPYKVISKIRFTNTSDFPEEIEFNKNLCPIIGSRSSGKSALLAYIAHAVDTEKVESLVPGPGEGEPYKWNKIGIGHSVVWGNEKSNEDCEGQIVYIPQNHLFDKSKNSNEIKTKIEPILFKKFPDFKANYKKVERNISLYNQHISDQVDSWFDLTNSIESLDQELKNLGSEIAIAKEKENIEEKIKKLKENAQLSDDDLKKYQEINTTLVNYADIIDIIKSELIQITDVTEEQHFFSELKTTLFPSISNLPKELKNKIEMYLKQKEDELLAQVNKNVLEYKQMIEKEKLDSETLASKIMEENKSLIERYKKNIELEDLVQKLSRYDEKINKIAEILKERKELEIKLEKSIEEIKSLLDKRTTLLKELKTHMDKADQNTLEGIEFGVEYGFDENLDEIIKKINTKEKSKYIKKYDEDGNEKISLDIDEIRNNPNEFLSALQSKVQKIIKGYEIKQVARDVLSLTEKILFNAKMENDKIGGFSEPTMTPGKRALFLLKIILLESEDTWPLLIDQPEDDLDSRSIYDDIVPFLKLKKKERQIIMVSHNANLVIGSDSEQIIVANRHGTDRKNEDGRQFNYLTGSLEYSKIKDKVCNDTLKSQGVCEHACEILDGGRTAFEQRKNKYNIS